MMMYVFFLMGIVGLWFCMERLVVEDIKFFYCFNIDWINVEI